MNSRFTSGQLSRDEWRSIVLSKVDPKRTALAVIDLQNDFCSEQGALAALGSDVSPCKAVAERIAEFLPKVREQMGVVAFFQLVYDIDEMSESQRERLIRDGKPLVCGAGSAGCELFLRPAPTDLLFMKHRYSVFTNEQFLGALRARSINTVVAIGVDTQICVEGTVRHGYDLGYRMLVLSDLVATRSSELARHENSLALCERYFSITLDSSEFLRRFSPRRAVALQHGKV
ncbi:MAG TPA: cysteine hydrolase [Candidatus Polarisedimenticolia bacterium]|nr:cysteine hydrolase [Candidatus Polarisedimenticolia bacterium]